MSASTDTAEAVERMFPPERHADPPLCAACFHGVAEHSLIGAGTCSGDAGSIGDAGLGGDCQCVRFRFPLRQPA